MRVLVTGITGFAGSHLADFLVTQGSVEVYGFARPSSSREHLDRVMSKVRLSVCDMTDGAAVARALKEIRPERIFHLAGQSFVPDSWQEPQTTLATNILGELNLLEAVRQADLQPFIHIAGSSEEYGSVVGKAPIKETAALNPLNPYGLSKLAQDLLGLQYHKQYQLKIVRTRAFPHLGPRQREAFVTSDFAKQVAEMEKGKRPAVLSVGNLEAVRDFTDVRDIVRAYWLCLDKGKAGEVYNICSGTGHQINEMAQVYLRHSRVKFEIKRDPRRGRSNEAAAMIGDGEKFRRRTGWTPAIPFERALTDVLNYWREKIE